MGRLYVSDELLPALRMLQNIYLNGKVSVEDVKTMVCHMAQNMEEKNSPHTPFIKENLDNTTHTTLKKISKKDDFVPPTLEEVTEYHRELGETDFTAEYFYDFYSSCGWITKSGNPVTDWKSLMKSWVKNEIRRKDNEQARTKNHYPSPDEQAEAREKQFTEWLTKNYPLPDKVDGESGENLVESFMRTYAVDQSTRFTRAEVQRLQEEGRLVSMAQVARILGSTAPVRHLVIRHLDSLVMDVNPSGKPPKLQTLVSMADTLFMHYFQMSMPELILAFNRFKSGAYGDFYGNLTKVRLMQAMREYAKQRTKS